MARGSTMTLSFPPFTKAVKRLIIINTAVYLLMLLLSIFAIAPASYFYDRLGLIPGAVLHGWIFQLVTYGFIHGGLMHLLFNMLMLWMFGSQFEMDWGSRKFVEFYFFCLVGAALTTVAVGAIGHVFFANSDVPFFRILSNIYGVSTIGASGAIYGILLAFGVLYGDREIFMFPLPFTMKAKYMVAILIFIAAVGAISQIGGVANFAHLGGAFFGWLYLRFIPRRGLQYATSEGYFGIRNRYIKWKRRRAARKFEVYMRKQKQPTNFSDYFDEYGNYKRPNAEQDRDKGNGEGRPPWVN